MKEEKINMVKLASKICGMSNVECPFCHTKDFDLEGLKDHLEHGDCEPYEAIDILSLKPRMFS